MRNKIEILALRRDVLSEAIDLTMCILKVQTLFATPQKIIEKLIVSLESELTITGGYITDNKIYSSSKDWVLSKLKANIHKINNQQNKFVLIILALVYRTLALTEQLAKYSNIPKQKCLAVAFYKLSNSLENHSNIENTESPELADKSLHALLKMLRNENNTLNIHRVLDLLLVNMHNGIFDYIIDNTNHNLNTFTKQNDIQRITDILDRIIFRNLKKNPAINTDELINNRNTETKYDLLTEIISANQKLFITNETLILFAEFLYLLAIHNMFMNQSINDLKQIIDEESSRLFEGMNGYQLAKNFFLTVKTEISALDKQQIIGVSEWSRFINKIMMTYKNESKYTTISNSKLWKQALLGIAYNTH